VLGDIVSACMFMVVTSMSMSVDRMGGVCAMIIYMFFQRRVIWNIDGESKEIVWARWMEWMEYIRFN
jgi:hypothetical protein